MSYHYNRYRCRAAAHKGPEPASRLLPGSQRSEPSAAGFRVKACDSGETSGGAVTLHSNKYNREDGKKGSDEGYKGNIILVVQEVRDSNGTVADPCAQQHQEAHPGLNFAALQRTRP